ncbi:hypothetical protein [Streptomyces sp. NPDC056061]|uniref:hypothetical protein n=1 Tax=Streptomyces sp. NPDC056061 TaxID=3345700 RepID=UPI0035E20B29
MRGDDDGLARLTLVFEAADTALRRLARCWDTIREKDDPKTSPAVDAFECVLFAGPQARIHILATSQLATGILGEGRENFSTKVMGRVTTCTWERLGPGDQPHPGPRPRRAGLEHPPDAGAAPDRRRSRRGDHRHGD